MKKDHSKPEKSMPHTSPAQEKSFTAALEQVALLLRTELKLKDRDTKVLKESSAPASFNKSIVQIAKLLRTQVRAGKSIKKRSWKVKKPS
jgi:hypothetical protein